MIQDTYQSTVQWKNGAEVSWLKRAQIVCFTSPYRSVRLRTEVPGVTASLSMTEDDQPRYPKTRLMSFDGERHGKTQFFNAKMEISCAIMRIYCTCMENLRAA